MASFSSAYVLCRIIDQKSLLGVTEDKNTNGVIVTLGENIAIRYELHDQKQLTSWSTSGKFSTNVLYDNKSNKYCAVFEKMYVKQWDRDDTELNKHKKIKCRHEIQSILLSDHFQSPLVQLKTGHLQYLNDNLYDCKSPVGEILKKGENLISSHLIAERDTLYLTLFSQIKQTLFCTTHELDKASLEPKYNTLKRLKLIRRKAKLLGQCVVQQDSTSAQLLTFWSDKMLYSLKLPLSNAKKLNVGTYLSTIDAVSSQFQVGMLPITDNYVALYAADATDEGAVLILYNLDFNIIQKRLHFKMFHKPPKLFQTHSHLLVVMGSSLVCVPFTIDNEGLSSVVGTRSVAASFKTFTDTGIMSCVPNAVWEGDSKENGVRLKCPQAIEDKFSYLEAEGWPESEICTLLLKDLIQTKDFETLHWCLTRFVDISEVQLVQLLSLSLVEPDENFERLNIDGWTVDETDTDFGSYANDYSSIKNPFNSTKKSNFVLKIISTQVNSFNLLKNLKLFLKVEDSIILLKFLNFVNVLNLDSDFALQWSGYILDSFYQQYIMSSDVEVLENIILMKNVISYQVAAAKDCQRLGSLLYYITESKCVLLTRPKDCEVKKLTLYSPKWFKVNT